MVHICTERGDNHTEVCVEKNTGKNSDSAVGDFL